MKKIIKVCAMVSTILLLYMPAHAIERFSFNDHARYSIESLRIVNPGTVMPSNNIALAIRSESLYPLENAPNEGYLLRTGSGRTANSTNSWATVLNLPFGLWLGTNGEYESHYYLYRLKGEKDIQTNSKY